MTTTSRLSVLQSGPGRAAAITLLGGLLCLTTVSAHWKHHDPQEGDTVWVTNRDRATLTVFDAVTEQSLTEEPIPVGVGAHDVVVSRKAHKAFVMNDTANTVSVVSLKSLDVIDTLDVGPGPHHAKLSWDGKTVFVGLVRSNTIAAIDTRSHDVRYYTSSQDPADLAHAPRPSPDGRFVYVPHETGNLITMLSVRTGAILRSMEPGDTSGGQPSEVLPTRDGDTLYVSMRNEGKIKTIDLDSFTTIDELFLGALTQPESLVLSPDERTLVVSMRGSPAQLAIINTRRNQLVATVPIAAASNTTGDLAVPSADGRYVYATYDAGASGQGGIAKLDLQNGKVTGWLYPTAGRPHGIYYSTAKVRRQN